MATIQSNPTPMSPTPKKKSNNSALIVALCVLGLIAAVSTYGWLSNSSKNADLQTELSETEEFKAQAEQKYYEALSELEEMRGDNEELNSLIDQQKAELKTAKEKIDGLTRDSRNLGAARRELKALRAQADAYIAELNTLREENQLLTDANNQLTTERDMLSTDLTAARQENQNLNETKAVLVSERDQLTQQKEQLSRKVTAGSVINVRNMVAVGQKQRNSGKFVDRNSAKNIDRINVCFETEENRVASPGEEVYYLRIIQPDGTTINIANEGGGVLRSEETGEMVSYSKPVNFQFDGESNNLCANWDVPTQQYSAGIYTIELYNKGYLAGATTLKLK